MSLNISVPSKAGTAGELKGKASVAATKMVAATVKKEAVQTTSDMDVQVNGTKLGPATQGKEVPLGEEIQDEEPVMNGNVEIRLPFDPVTLVAREAGVLDDSQ